MYYIHLSLSSIQCGMTTINYYVMKKNMCKGCSYLCDRIQVQYWGIDNTTLITPPLRTMKPFCRNYELHIESVEQIITGNRKCKRYCE